MASRSAKDVSGAIRRVAALRAPPHWTAAPEGCAIGGRDESLAAAIG